jgi:hypothetical protein
MTYNGAMKTMVPIREACLAYAGRVHDSAASVFQAHHKAVDALKDVVLPGRCPKDEVHDTSFELKRRSVRDAVAITDVPKMAADARQSALRALAAGALCGALDGMLIYAAELGIADPAHDDVPKDLEENVGKLTSGLARARAVASKDWKATDADSLQLLAGYGKQSNLQTAEEAAALAEKATLVEFQTFLLATFKAGYAVGLADSAIICVHRQSPDPIQA